MSSPTIDRAVPLPRATAIALWLGVPICFGLLSVAVGRPVDWDLMNYHYYNPYAFIQGRLHFDVAPAQLQSYFNPLIDIPFYALARTLPARLVGFLMGFEHGLNFSLVFLLFWRMARIQSVRTKTIASTATALVCCAAPAFAWELGRTSNDNLLSLFILCNLLALHAASQALGESETRRAVGWTITAGLLMGSAVGLKQTAVPFCFGSAVALVVGLSSWRTRLRGLVLYGLAGVTGVLLALGHWSWVLWVDFGNPVFPMLNDFFQSPAAQPQAYTGVRFSPDGLWKNALWPFLFSWDLNLVWERKGTDFRFALLYGLALLSLMRWPWGRKSERNARDLLFPQKEGSALLAFFLVSFLSWMIIFSVYRYIVVLELLAPICFLVLIDRFGLPQSAQRVAVLFGVLLLAAGMLYSARVHGGVDVFTGGRLHWTERFFEVDATPFESPDSTIVVMLGPSPTAFVIPELPPEMRFLRPEGNLRLRERNGLHAEVTSSLQEHTGAVYIMFSDPPSKPFNPIPGARRLGLEYDPTQCFSLDHNRTYTVIRFCKVR